MDIFNSILDGITNAVFYSVTFGDIRIPLIVAWLIIAAIFFTVYLGFQNIRGFKHALDLVRGKYSKPEDAGEVSHFQALATAVSGTVGLGNIAGVAVAVSLGGPGATFWMIVAGFLGMSAKMAECTLGVKYRKEHPDGTVSGGPMYYLRDGIAQIGKPGLGKVLAAAFAVFCVLGSLGGGNMFQSNQATQQVMDVMGASPDNAALAFGIGAVFAVAVGLVIIGGIKSIAKVTEKVVPFMAVLYITACLVIIAVNIGYVPTAFGQIISGAFSPEGAVGGVIGVLIVGFQRAAFSNEAGIGSASIAHSAVKTKEPATEGFVSLLEPFIDTICICTMTALVIVITGVWTDEATIAAGGVALTSSAFASVVSWFPYVLALAVVLFALSTMLSWSYYGMKATGYLFGDNKTAENIYKVIFCLFTVLGAGLALDSVLGFSDAAIFLMSIPNLIGLYLLARVLKKEINQYRNKIATGEIAPVK
ncbi:alanine/glycine:cation symporter family protein [Millisia brevis]|uniref:alanine/glycine:cation symporter family protein n=1 Tax=Millisia brevis TaxID=264148 RepID=UPI00082DE8BB|nr:alanine/glycine:cation symporter family protein [Millisia brevis]